MDNATLMSRLRFGFTVTYHYRFPQRTMGLALLLVVLKSLYLRCGNEIYHQAVHCWARIFAVSFIMAVVTGIPMAFQFGTNWAQFSRAAAGRRESPSRLERTPGRSRPTRTASR